jgi:integrase
MRITKRAVDALRPGPRAVFLYDDELRGFGVRCLPSGVKSYFLKYRTKGGRQRWYTIEAKTPQQARALAWEEKASAKAGRDPAGERKQKKREGTVAEIAGRYLAEHVQIHNKPSTAAEVERIVANRIKPSLGRIKIGEITRADIKAWHQRMRATPYEANRSLAYLSKMLSLAAHDWELRPDNPCIGVKRFAEKRRERFFSDDELRRLGAALAAAERDQATHPGAIALIRTLAVTGLRLGEALSLRWSDVDLPGRALRLPDAKAGARTVHIGAAAAMILDALPDRAGHVFRRLDTEAPLTAGVVHNAWERLCKAAQVFGRLHDLRHTVGTVAAMTGANAFAIRDLLGHRTLAMTGRYVERAGGVVQATADAVASRVAAALASSEHEPAKVVELPQRPRPRAPRTS